MRERGGDAEGADRGGAGAAADKDAAMVGGAPGSSSVVCNHKLEREKKKKYKEVYFFVSCLSITMTIMTIKSVMQNDVKIR